MVRVWDRWVRISHWSLAAIVFADAFANEGGEFWHSFLGYVGVALVAFRILWGFVGPEHARFRRMLIGWPARGRFLTHAREYLAGRAPRTLDHTPLAMIGMGLMLLCVALLGLTGWMMSWDRFFGEEWLESSHETLSDVLLVLVAIHVTGVVLESIRHRENLVGAMIHGKKRPLDGGLGPATSRNR